MSKKIKIKKVENVYFYGYYAFICQNSEHSERLSKTCYKSCNTFFITLNSNGEI